MYIFYILYEQPTYKNVHTFYYDTLVIKYTCKLLTRMLLFNFIGHIFVILPCTRAVFNTQ